MYKLSPFTYNFSQSGKLRKIFLESNLTFEANETIAIVGPSGSGKSTLLKILKGIIPEYSSGILEGEVLFKGNPLDGVHFQNNLTKILYLFQNPFSQLIYPSTEEEFLFSMENFNFTKEEMNTQRAIFENLFNLKNIWGKKTSQLSNGECQKLVLASLLAIGPEVLLLDEPTAFLDPEARKEFYTYLSQIRDRRLVIIIDHHIDEIRPLISKMIKVDSNGKISECDKDSINLVKPMEMKIPLIVNNNIINIKINDLSFSYNKNIQLLKNVQISITGGEVIAIKGANGEGKSTLLKLIAGILSPDKGSIATTIGSREFKNKKNFNNVGFIFQNPENHFFFDTIEEELKQSFKKIVSTELKNELLSNFFYNIDLKKSPFLLSEGEKRRLSILMTIFLGKSILLYDEPTFGQDQASIEQIIALIKEMKKQKIVQIFISHDEKIIKETADRVFELKDGILNEVS